MQILELNFKIQIHHTNLISYNAKEYSLPVTVMDYSMS